MNCISSPQLNDSDLLAYGDGLANSAVTEHIRQCPHCRQKAARLARLQEQLTTHLFRVACPAPEDIGEFHAEMLPPNRRAEIAQHLGECPHCVLELEQLQAYLADLSPDLEISPLERLKERARVLVAHLVTGGGMSQLPLVPAPVGIRGDEAGPAIYQAEGVEVLLEVQEDAERPDRRAILGLVTGLEDAGQTKVTVIAAGEPVAITSVDELGNFIIPNLVPAAYDLVLAGPTLDIHISDFNVGSTPA